MAPVAVSAAFTTGWRRGLTGIAIQPLRYAVVVKLLTIHHAGKCLSLNVARIGAGNAFLEFAVEVICFLQAIIKQFVKRLKRFCLLHRTESQIDNRFFTGINLKQNVKCSFATFLLGADSPFNAVYNVIINSVFSSQAGIRGIV